MYYVNQKVLRNITGLLSAYLIIGFVSCEKPTQNDPFANTNDPPANTNPISKPTIIECRAVYGEPYRGFVIRWNDNDDNTDGFHLDRKGPNESNFTRVTNLSKSDYYFQDLGSFEPNLTYTYRLRAYAGDSESDWSVISQQADGLHTGTVSSYVDYDSFVREKFPNSNYGDWSSLTVAGYQGEISEIFLSIPLPTLPSYNRGISAAVLRLCEAGGGNTSYPGSIGVYASPILSSWSENTITYNNKPGAYKSKYGYTDHNPNTITCAGIYVTDIVTDWYTGVRSNFGFLVYSQSNAYVAYYSREGYQPGSSMLTVQYYW